MENFRVRFAPSTTAFLHVGNARNALAQEIKKEIGYKGKNLYYHLRLALKARRSGLELDKFIPLVEEGARMNFPVAVKNCSQRVSEVLSVWK